MSPLPLLLLAVLLATTYSQILQLNKLLGEEDKQQDEHQRQDLVQEKEHEQGLEQEQDKEELQEQEPDVHPLVSWHAWPALSLVGAAGTLANGFLLHTFYRSHLVWQWNYGRAI